MRAVEAGLKIRPGLGRGGDEIVERRARAGDGRHIGKAQHDPGADNRIGGEGRDQKMDGFP